MFFLACIHPACNSVLHLPTDKYQAQGASVTFSCQHNEYLAATWLIDSELYHGMYSATVNEGNGWSNLTFQAPAGHNRTVNVSCLATVNGSSGIKEEASSATLYIQGRSIM